MIENDNKTMIVLHKLIYQVLIEIREEAYLIDNKKIFKLSDLVHNLPIELSNAANDRKELLSKLKAQAKSTGTDKWLDNALSQL